MTNRLVPIIGVLVAIMGLVFILQGAGIFVAIPSFMNNDRNWIWIGLAILLVGLALIGYPSLTRPRNQK